MKGPFIACWHYYLINSPHGKDMVTVAVEEAPLLIPLPSKEILEAVWKHWSH